VEWDIFRHRTGVVQSDMVVINSGHHVAGTGAEHFRCLQLIAGVVAGRIVWKLVG